MKMRTLLVVCMIAAGVVPMGIASLIITRHASSMMYDNTYNLLNAEISGRKGYIESYLHTVEGQNQALAENLMVKNAMRDFTNAFADLPTDLGLDTQQTQSMTQQVKRFYRGDFSRRLSELGQGKPNVDSIVPRSQAGLVAQHLYIADNDNPLGEKDALLELDNGSRYDVAHQKFHTAFRTYLQEFGYYDIFLIEPENGNIVYSVFKEVDYATSLWNGPYRNSGLSEAAREAMTLPQGSSVIVDFKDYSPSYGSPASFIASPIYINGEVAGALAYQMPIDRINHVMEDHAGLGETGELVLLGPDQLMRSQSRFSDESTVLRQSINTESVTLALQGKTGTLVETDDGVEYLSAYAPLQIAGLDWVISARIQSDEALNSVKLLLIESLIITLVSAFAVALMAFFVGRHLNRKLGGDPADLQRAANAIGQGDLTSNPGDENSIGTFGAIVAMRTKLRSVLEESIDVANEVRHGAGELSEANIGLSERTEQQAANLEETASSTEEITSTVKQNAENTRNANELAIQTRERATATGDVADRAVKAMQDITSSSERIADIISVIDEIAFQTNLLALNAAVEAARAGEQGRGFAVVATEVRQLAGRSASAAKEIKDLIEDSVNKVKGGTKLVQESGGELEHIVTSVTKLTDIVGQIAVASDEQAAGIEQINQALVHMDSVTQQNAAMVEEAAATSRSMRDQATLLSSQIGFFSSNDHSDVPALGNAALPKDLVHLPQKKTINPPSSAAANASSHDAASTTPPPKAAGSDELWDEF